MDLFTERLVSKKWEKKDLALSILLFFVALVISLMAFMFLEFIAIVICAVSFFGAYQMSCSLLMVEYEYTVTNDELEIDKIIAKRKRIHLKTLNIKEIEAGSKYKGEQALMLCPDKNSENLYILEKCGEKIVIDPNETMLKAFELYMGNRFTR